MIASGAAKLVAQLVGHQVAQHVAPQVGWLVGQLVEREGWMAFATRIAPWPDGNGIAKTSALTNVRRSVIRWPVRWSVPADPRRLR